MLRLLFVLILFSAAAYASPASLFGFAEFEPHETPAPVAKLTVLHDAYVDVIIGNPGRTVRLRIDFGQNTSIVLFSPPDDLSREFSLVPPTLLVYIGPALVRLAFAIDPTLHDARAAVKYDGVLGLGYASNVWDYWGVVSVSAQRLVLGEFDKSLSRATYKPFRLDFTREFPEVLVIVNNINFTLTYDPAEYYSTFPHLIYHNITNFDLKFNKLHMEIDSNDIRMRLTSGFDRTLVKKNVDIEDTRIVLGQHFSRNFVLYYNVVNRSKHIMPAFDLFGIEHAEPLYSHVLFILFFLLLVFWLAVVTADTRNRTPDPKAALVQGRITDKPVKGVTPIVYSAVELYTYIAVGVVCLVEIGGFAYYRHMAFWMSTTSTASYVVFNSLLVSTTLVGALLAATCFNTFRLLNVRRVFVEAALVMLMWMVLTHWTHVMATFVQVVIVSTYCVLRGLQAALAYVVRSYRNLAVNLLYFIFGLLFYAFYVLAPTINFYFFGFAHSFNAGVFIFAFTLALPLMAVLAFYPTSLVRNSVIATDRSHHLSVIRRRPPAPQRPAPPSRDAPQARRRMLLPGSFGS